MFECIAKCNDVHQITGNHNVRRANRLVYEELNCLSNSDGSALHICQGSIENDNHVSLTCPKTKPKDGSSENRNKRPTWRDTCRGERAAGDAPASRRALHPHSLYLSTARTRSQGSDALPCLRPDCDPIDWNSASRRSSYQRNLSAHSLPRRSDGPERTPTGRTRLLPSARCLL